MNQAGKACQRYLVMLAVAAVMLLASAKPAAAATAEEKTVYTFLTDTMGYSPAAASGVMSNIFCESRFIADQNGLGGAYGICQWGGARQSRLISWCSGHGYKHTTLTGQLRFLQYEVKTYFPKVDNYMKSVKNTAAGAYNAGFYWCYYFEIPANTYSSAVYRGNLAKSKYWKEIGSRRTFVTAQMEKNGVKLKWNATSKYGYVIKRAHKDSGSYQTLATVAGTKKTYLDRSALQGKKYYYYIQPLNEAGKELERSNKVSCNVKPSIQDEQCSITLAKTTYTYTGKAKKPKVIVNYEGERLRLNKDYTVDYSKNINAGTGYVTIRGKGSYAGSCRLSFTIEKAEQDLKAVSLKTYYKKGETVSLKAAAPGKISYVSSDKTVASVKNKKLYLKGAGIARITVKAAATANYNAASREVLLTVRPGETMIKTVTPKNGMITLSWKTYKSVTGYEIQYAPGSGLKSDAELIRVEDESTDRYVITDLEEDQLYSLRVRCYKETDGKILYGKWTPVKKVTVE